MRKGDFFVAVAVLVASFLLDPFVSSLSVVARNPFLDLVFSWFSNVASVFVILILMTSMFLWEEHRKRWIKPLWIAFFGSLLLCYLLKFVVMRPRPFGVELIPFINLVDYSFPSTHAAVAFSALPVLDFEHPHLKWFWVGFAVLVVVSRLYFGIHYLSDVVAGIFIGYFFGRGVLERLRR